MIAVEKATPTVVCAACNHAAYSLSRIADICPKCRGSVSKRGVYRSTLASDDWIACGRCHTSGHMHDRQCRHCNGVGWLFARVGGFDGRIRQRPQPVWHHPIE